MRHASNLWSRTNATSSCLIRENFPGHSPAMADSPLSDRERLAWLRLWRSENVGPQTFRQLLRRLGGVEAALDALPELARRGGRDRPLAVCPAAVAERELD